MVCWDRPMKTKPGQIWRKRIVSIGFSPDAVEENGIRYLYFCLLESPPYSRYGEYLWKGLCLKTGEERNYMVYPDIDELINGYQE